MIDDEFVEREEEKRPKTKKRRIVKVKNLKRWKIIKDDESIGDFLATQSWVGASFDLNHDSSQYPPHIS